MTKTHLATLYVDNGDKESALYQSQPETQSLAKTLVLSHRLRFLTNSSPLSSSILSSSTLHHQQHPTPQHLNNDSYIEWLLFGEFTFILRVSSDFRFFEYPSDFRRCLEPTSCNGVTQHSNHTRLLVSENIEGPSYCGLSAGGTVIDSGVCWYPACAWCFRWGLPGVLHQAFTVYQSHKVL